MWAPTLAALVVVFVTVSLGNWKWRRADEKRAQQAQRDAAERDPPIDVTGPDIDVKALDGRRVRVRGRFVSEFDVFVDNRTYRGVAGFHVLSPLRLAGSDSHVLVLRGWVASDPRQRWRVPSVPTPGPEVEVEGIALRGLARTLGLGRTPAPGPAAVQREGPRLSRVARLARLVQSCAITGARAVVIGADWTS